MSHEEVVEDLLVMTGLFLNMARLHREAVRELDEALALLAKSEKDAALWKERNIAITGRHSKFVKLAETLEDAARNMPSYAYAEAESRTLLHCAREIRAILKEFDEE